MNTEWKFLFAFIASVLIATGARDVLAQDWWAACSAERQRFCADIPSGGGRIAACISEHYDQLSASCKATVPTPRQGSNRPVADTSPPQGGRATSVPARTPLPEVVSVSRQVLPTSAIYHGPYQVRGTNIADGSGRIVRFRGINSSGLEFGSGQPYGTAQCGDRMYGCYHAHKAQEYLNSAGLGFNLIRLPLSWANIEPMQPEGGNRHQYNEAYLREVDSAINLAKQAGLPVIVSFHSNNWSAAYPQGGGMPTWLYSEKGNPQAAFSAFLANENSGQDHYVAMLAMVAKRYANEDVFIGIDVYNEPRLPAQGQQQAVSALESLYERAAIAIRGQNNRLLVVVQDFVDRYPRLTRLPRQPGIIYSFHSYGPWAGARGQSALAHIDWATGQGVPSFIGEFGRKNNPDWKEDIITFLGSVRRDDVSWALFAYQFYEYPLYGQFGDGQLDRELLEAVRTGF